MTELFQPVKLSETLKTSFCNKCIKDNTPFCEGLYVHECYYINKKLADLTTPCSTCAYISLIEGSKDLFCGIHNCPHYNKFLAAVT